MELSDLCFPSITLAPRFCMFCMIFIVFAGSPIRSEFA